MLLPSVALEQRADESLEEAGYDIFFARRRRDGALPSRDEGGHQTFLIQGHPNTIRQVSCASIVVTPDATSAMRAPKTYPLPYHCVSPDDWEALVRLTRQSYGDRDPLSLERIHLTKWQFESTVAVALAGRNALHATG